MTNDRHQRWRVILVAVMSLLTAITGLSQFAEPGDQPLVKVSTFWSDTGVKPGAEITLGVVLDIRPPYHSQRVVERSTRAYQLNRAKAESTNDKWDFNESPRSPRNPFPRARFCG